MSLVHYASRRDDPCPTADTNMPLRTACDVLLPELPAGDRAREDINAVTCPDCLAAHAIWTDMRRAKGL